MICQDFIFHKKHLSDFGFFMAKPSESESSGLSREILKGSVTSFRSEANHYGTKYNETLSLHFFIVKNNFNDNNPEISLLQLRKIQAWLTYSKLPQTLYLVTQEGEFIEYCGIFTDIIPFECDGLNGFNLVFTCNSPFAYHTKEITFPSSGTGVTSKTIYCDTDELGEMIYPIVSFIPGSAGEISVVNKNDNQSMSFHISRKYQNVMIDCKMKRIIADNEILSLSDVGWNTNNIIDYSHINTGIFKMYWLRFLPGKNVLDFSGDGRFTITYKIPLKIGGLVHV